MPRARGDAGSPPRSGSGGPRHALDTRPITRELERQLLAMIRHDLWRLLEPRQVEGVGSTADAR